jgi:hypothetical protein
MTDFSYDKLSEKDKLKLQIYVWVPYLRFYKQNVVDKFRKKGLMSGIHINKDIVYIVPFPSFIKTDLSFEEKIACLKNYERCAGSGGFISLPPEKMYDYKNSTEIIGLCKNMMFQ